MGGLCNWDKNKCIKMEFCQILNYDPDYYADDKRCVYLVGKCTNFTGCDQYVGDKRACEAISNYFMSQDGKKYEDKVIPSCSDYGSQMMENLGLSIINASNFNLISGFDWLPKEKCKYHLTNCDFQMKLVSQRNMIMQITMFAVMSMIIILSIFMVLILNLQNYVSWRRVIVLRQCQKIQLNIIVTFILDFHTFGILIQILVKVQWFTRQFWSYHKGYYNDFLISL
ncbi:unnamed protein product [Paramecium octaurelia]|uniref:Transmembrane protein n=1 Tax=Paramecium octaurelia TaxID=43137 RepID=A0A8S1W2L3_PAROT|nr:unnamed protein product [Paramecium octaurelia]